jgi:UMF1 family MFS transporter
MLTGIYAAGILHWSPRTLTIQGLINCVCAVFAGLCASWLDSLVGSRWSTFVFVSGALVANAVLATLTPTSVLFMHVDPVSAAGDLFPTLSDKILSATLAATATFVTAGFASSRALMAKLSPPAMLNEFFGLYALSGTATSFFGPLAIGVATTAFQSQRAGVLVGMGFLIVGLALLVRVREDSGV